jgi:hypothetical protein
MHQHPTDRRQSGQLLRTRRRISAGGQDATAQCHSPTAISPTAMARPGGRVHDAVLIHRMGDSMHDHGGKGDVPPPASRCRSERRISVTFISTRPWMKFFRRAASKLSM